jgi:hypothetical protein
LAFSRAFGSFRGTLGAPNRLGPVAPVDSYEGLGDGGWPHAARRVGPKRMTALLKAATRMPTKVADPIEPGLELEVVLDSDFPDDPSLDVYSEDMTR